jgi:23S rRNA (guanosine2251-2'-O)-methyltransferase
VNHLKDAIYLLQAYGISTIGASEKASRSLFEMGIPKKVAVVMGSEERGINPSTQKTLDHLASLPIKGSVESLNVSVACGVFLYEILRKRQA